MFNYPNHPLFRITPLLDRGFNTVLHDEYTSHLVGRIRAGRYTPELWDCNGFYLNYHDRLDAPADGQIRAAKSRYKMTPEERKAWANSYGDPELNASRERRRAEQAKRDAVYAEERKERERFAKEHAERLAAREAALEERAREWARVGAESQQYLTERAMIMGGSWECSRCLTPSEVTSQPAGRYAISCRRCGRRAVGGHAELLRVMNARKTQPEPEIALSRL